MRNHPTLHPLASSRAFLPTLAGALLLMFTLAACDSGGDDGGSDDPVNQFRVEITNVQDQTQGAPFPVFKSGVFNTPIGAGSPGPIAPGEAYEVQFTIGPTTVPPLPGARLSFATMFIQSNDLFYAFRPEGLALYNDDGTPIGTSGPEDVTDQVFLYDAGTEVNEEPGTGPNQAPRQSGPDTGEDENGTVELITDVGDGAAYPATEDVIRVTVENTGGPAFTLRIENVSAGTTVGGNPIPLSPGAWGVHTDQAMFYQVGAAASESVIGAGLETIAEDGDPAPAAEAVTPITGITVPLSPGGFAVHDPAVQLYNVGEPASQGIEDIAEDGIPTALTDALTGLDGVSVSDAFGVDGGASETTGPIGPGASYSFTFEASPGDVFSFATMYIQSNDFFYGFAPQGLPLFDANNMPISGDVSNLVVLYDGGTEVDEEPGVGLTQIIRSAPDTGDDEGGTVTNVAIGASGGSDDGFDYPPVTDIIRVTITPVQ